MRIKKGDTVIVTAGSHKGKTGEVIESSPDKDRIVVSGVNMRTRHRKPRVRGEKGVMEKREAPIHISNVQMVDPSTKKPTRVKHIFENGVKKRVAVKSGKVV